MSTELNSVSSIRPEKFSRTVSDYLRGEAEREIDELKKIQLETAQTLYRHLSSGSIPTAAGPERTAEAMGLNVEEEGHSLSYYIAEYLNRQPDEVKVLNIGDPFLKTADESVVTLDPVSLEEKKDKEQKVVNGVFPAVPFKDESFDAIVCKNSLGYPMAEMNSQQIEVVLNEMLRLVNTGGIIMINSIEYDTPDVNETYFGFIRKVLVSLKKRGIIEYEYTKTQNITGETGHIVYGNSEYTIRVKKVANYTPEPFPEDIVTEIGELVEKDKE